MSNIKKILWTIEVDDFFEQYPLDPKVESKIWKDFLKRRDKIRKKYAKTKNNN